MKQRKLAPIALFVYARPQHTKKTVDALAQNALAKESELFIFSDGPKNFQSSAKVGEVRGYLRSIKGFKSVKIFESKVNMGLAGSIVAGVTKIVNKYKKIIVLEDDLVTSKYFLTFMNDALDFYSNEPKVVSISGYVYQISNLPKTFFLKGAECWGWATWKRGWKVFEKNGTKLLKQLQEKNLVNEFDFNGSFDYSQMLKDQIAGKNSSWAIRWYASAFINNKLTLYPRKSLVQNIGVDGSGTHGGFANVYYTKLSASKIPVEAIPLAENLSARKGFELFFNKIHSRLYKLCIFVKNFFVYLSLPQ